MKFVLRIGRGTTDSNGSFRASGKETLVKKICSGELSKQKQGEGVAWRGAGEKKNRVLLKEKRFRTFHEKETIYG